MPRLNSIFTEITNESRSSEKFFLGTLSVLSFPLPNILLSLQYINYAPIYRRAVYNDYLTGSISHNSYISNYPGHLTLNKTSDDTLEIQWDFTWTRLFSLQIIAISYDYFSQNAHHRKLYNYSGNIFKNNSLFLIYFKGQAYANFYNVSVPEQKVTFSCLCAECDDIEWRRDYVPLPKSNYGVVDLKKEFWPYYTMNLKHSKFTTLSFDTAIYTCYPVHFQNDRIQFIPAFIQNPCKNHILALKLA